MASGNKKLLAVVLGGLVLGVGFIVVYLKVLGPRAEQERIQKEVTAYADAWTAMRACIVGPEPQAQDGAHAVAVRALLEPDLEAALAPCDELARPLVRPETGYPGEAIDKAWKAVEKARKAVVQAQAMVAHASKAREAGAGYGDETLRRDLGAAVAAFDAALATLRRETRLPEAPPPGPPLAPLEATPITAADGAPLPPFQPTARGAVVIDRPDLGDRALLYRQSSKDAIERFPIGADVMVSATGGFGVWLDEPEAQPTDVLEAIMILKVGPLDATGDPAGPGVELHRGRSTSFAPRFALGAGELRLVAWSLYDAETNEQQLVVARSRDGGQTWPIAPPDRQVVPLRAPLLVEDYAQTRLDAIGELADGLGWLSLRPDTLDGPLAPLPLLVDPAATRATGTCFAGDVAYVPTGDRLVRAGPGGSSTEVTGWPSMVEPYTCTATHVLGLAHTSAGVTATVCGASGCASSPVVATPVGATMLAALEGERPVLAFVADGVVALWRVVTDGGWRPAIHLLPDGCALEGVAIWPDGPVGVLACEGATRLAPLR